MSSHESLRVGEGEVITAAKWNALVRLASRKVTGSNIIETSTGFHIKTPISLTNPIVQFKIIRLGNNKTRFICKNFDENGDGIGDEFSILARSYPATIDGIGNQELDNCYPSFIPGDFLMCQLLNIWNASDIPDEARFVHAFWAERGDPFFLRC